MALSTDAHRRNRTGAFLETPVAAGALVFLGALVGLTQAGFAVPAASDPTLSIIGVARARADNRGGVDGTLRVALEAGTFRFRNHAGDQVDAAQVGQLCWAVDDETVAGTSDAGARPIAGVVAQVDAAWVWVTVGPTQAATGAALRLAEAAPVRQPADENLLGPQPLDLIPLTDGATLGGQQSQAGWALRYAWLQQQSLYRTGVLAFPGRAASVCLTINGQLAPGDLVRVEQREAGGLVSRLFVAGRDFAIGLGASDVALHNLARAMVWSGLRAVVFGNSVWILRPSPGPAAADERVAWSFASSAWGRVRDPLSGATLGDSLASGAVGFSRGATAGPWTDGAATAAPISPWIDPGGGNAGPGIEPPAASLLMLAEAEARYGVRPLEVTVVSPGAQVRPVTGLPVVVIGALPADGDAVIVTAPDAGPGAAVVLAAAAGRAQFELVISFGTLFGAPPNAAPGDQIVVDGVSFTFVADAPVSSGATRQVQIGAGPIASISLLAAAMQAYLDEDLAHRAWVGGVLTVTANGQAIRFERPPGPLGNGPGPEYSATFANPTGSLFARSPDFEGGSEPIANATERQAAERLRDAVNGNEFLAVLATATQSTLTPGQWVVKLMRVPS